MSVRVLRVVTGEQASQMMEVFRRFMVNLDDASNLLGTYHKEFVIVRLRVNVNLVWLLNERNGIID